MDRWPIVARAVNLPAKHPCRRSRDPARSQATGALRLSAPLQTYRQGFGNNITCKNNLFSLAKLARVTSRAQHRGAALRRFLQKNIPLGALGARSLLLASPQRGEARSALRPRSGARQVGGGKPRHTRRASVPRPAPLPPTSPPPAGGR